MVRDQSVFRNPTRPPAGIESKQTHKRARRRSQRDGRRPNDVRSRLQPVGDAKLRQRDRQRLRRSVGKRPPPEAERPFRKQVFPRLNRSFGSEVQQSQDVQNDIRSVDAFRPVGGVRLRERLLPSLDGRKRRVLRQDARPVPGKTGKWLSTRREGERTDAAPVPARCP